MKPWLFLLAAAFTGSGVYTVLSWRDAHPCVEYGDYACETPTGACLAWGAVGTVPVCFRYETRPATRHGCIRRKP